MKQEWQVALTLHQPLKCFQLRYAKTFKNQQHRFFMRRRCWFLKVFLESRPKTQLQFNEALLDELACVLHSKDIVPGGQMLHLNGRVLTP